jgi:hypothetical protein
MKSAALAGQVLSPNFSPTTLTANDNGVTLTLSLSPLPQPASPTITCGGADAYTDTDENFTSSNWSIFFVGQSVDFYTSAPYVPCGGLAVDLGGNITSTYSVTSYTPPANWTAGDTGQLATETNYSASGTWLPPAVETLTATGPQISTDVISYQVAPYSPSAVLLTITDQNSVNGTQANVFTVTADGAMTLQSVSLSQGGQTITLTD